MKTIDVPRKGYVYVMHLEGTPYYKIGCSAEPEARLKQLQFLYPFTLALACDWPVDDMYGEERALHERYAKKRVRGEWFKLDLDDMIAIRGEGVVAGLVDYYQTMLDAGLSPLEAQLRHDMFMEDMKEVVMTRPRRVTFGGAVQWNAT